MTDTDQSVVILEGRPVDHLGVAHGEKSFERLTLHEFYAHYISRGTSEEQELDEDIGELIGTPKEITVNVSITLLKSKIETIKSLWDRRQQAWFIIILATESDITFVVRNRIQAHELHDKILEWLIK